MHQKEDLSLSPYLYIVAIAILLSIYVSYKMRKILIFTAKLVFIGISKNEISSKRYIKNIFGMYVITINISNHTISKIYSKTSRCFDHSILNNITFKRID